MTRARHPARFPEAGLTLIEMMVVLAVVGIAGGLALAIFRPDAPARRLAGEAGTLAATLALAADEALVTGRPLALRWQAAGYDFVQWNREATGWQPADLPALAAFHAFEPGIAAAGGVAETGVVLLSPAADGPAFRLVLAAGGHQATVWFDGLTASVEPPVSEAGNGQ